MNLENEGIEKVKSVLNKLNEQDIYILQKWINSILKYHVDSLQNGAMEIYEDFSLITKLRRKQMKLEEYLNNYFKKEAIKEWSKNPHKIDIEEFRTYGSYEVETLYDMADDFFKRQRLSFIEIMGMYVGREDCVKREISESTAFLQTIIKLACEKLMKEKRNES